ncbi:N(2)-acetyl-L-2,4-diaminobutanoate deacetylase DoeB2 [Catenovulum sp. 2E275]|uniref:N(2)-acetyl-L-2,4-diaminobutanoate deacetylase DoeB2 n=1 Tax=Catenovulum sp. 2E275 TaxID=2980497 RepID=UPI0021CFA2BC|nr:N(2)-acetyl-L-2,4-diaminobutanoate deacetylase DoeB2 [Catenovulum sp. 2E275]MCU4676423.1 N(2)-acetyl-L-2,4-diaminobutanoate deacetylase DoeB2 [Catenovulum sp. 2E275]
MSTNWQAIIDSAIQTRRFLHQNPELSWQEVNTAQFIRQQLDKLNIRWRECAKTGTLAFINFDNSVPDSKTIALRGDIDALPINENTNTEWQSNNQGCMHACGHDGHCATLLASAQWLKQNEAKLSNRIVLIFQPAEEGGHGAREMIADGALDGVDEIYGWHNWPAISFGQMLCPDNIVMCGNGTFEILVEGKGGHASQPELCADPVLAASAIHLALQQIISRKIAPQQSAVVSVTSITADSSATVIPQTAQLSGSIRVPNDSIKNQINQLIDEISQHTAKAYACRANITHFPRYSATINHTQQAQNMRFQWRQLFGDSSLANVSAPIMASEDFSYYLREIPGAFALIGSDDGNGHHIPCHSPEYDFNDKLIAKVCQLYASLAGLTQ